MKQSFYCDKVCDRGFIIGVNLFLSQLCVHAYRFTILCKKGTNFVSRCWGLLLEDSGAIAKFL